MNEWSLYSWREAAPSKLIDPFFHFSKSLFKPLLIVSCMEKTLNRGRKEIISFSVLSYLNWELSMSWDMVHVFWIISTVQKRHPHSNLFWLGYQEWRLMAPLLFSLRARLFLLAWTACQLSYESCPLQLPLLCHVPGRYADAMRRMQVWFQSASWRPEEKRQPWLSISLCADLRVIKTNIFCINLPQAQHVAIAEPYQHTWMENNPPSFCMLCDILLS